MRSPRISDEDLIAAFAAVEHEAEVPYKPYREVLALSLRGMGERLGFAVSDAQAAGFGTSVGQWPAFPDSADALRRLQERFKLAVITNCDDDLFAQSERRLGVAFDYVITAQQAGSYKPDHANFLLAFERIDEPRERILHVAQSLFHDHVPGQGARHDVGLDRPPPGPGRRRLASTSRRTRTRPSRAWWRSPTTPCPPDGVAGAYRALACRGRSSTAIRTRART